MDPTPRLAAQAATLATEINVLGENCMHDAISNDICNISGELTLLSTTLCRLHEAMTANKSSYTESFRQDLEEIAVELGMVFEEVDECCVELQKSDASSSSTGWFFKKGRTARLQKHLEALKTTVVVMRTVLHHGKEYGVQTSPGRLAESTPHTMSEDRAILESIFVKNRRAIVNSATSKGSHSHNPSSSSEATPELSPGAHGRNLSFATGVDSIAVADVLPPSSKDAAERAKREEAASLARRFSKRTGLGIHKQILEIKAENTEAALRKRWIRPDQVASIMASIDEKGVIDAEKPLAATDSQQQIDTRSSERPKSRSNNLALMTSSVGKSLSRAIQRLSLAGKQTTKENKSPSDSQTASGEGPVKSSNESHNGPTDVLKARFANPSLTTPDFNREFENGERI